MVEEVDLRVMAAAVVAVAAAAVMKRRRGIRCVWGELVMFLVWTRV